MSGQQQIPYLEERKLIKRWSGPWPMLANMAFTLLIFAVTWWVFQDPRGIMRFYTPYVGYNYCRWWLIILIWMAYIFDFWPFRRDWVRSAHPLQKGLVLALVSVGIMIAMIHGFFEGVLGNLAFAYFNPAQLQKLGLTDFYSTEYAAQACMMFAVIASWISPAWVVALEGQPWANASQPVRGCMEVRYYGPTGYALVATTIALEGRIRNYFDICNNMLTTLSYSAGWSTAPKPVPAQPVYSGDTGDYGTAYYWYDEDGDVWYWNGYENEFISYGSDGYIDTDSGEYMENNDAGWDYSDAYYDDYDPWSDPGDGWDDYAYDDEGWGDYF